MARYHKMSVDQDWNSVWPTSSMFKQCTVPFAVRQGYVKNSVENDGLPPEKYGNTELMKIPNFLHLTPPQIKKHCEAIKSNSVRKLFLRRAMLILLCSFKNSVRNGPKNLKLTRTARSTFPWRSPRPVTSMMDQAFETIGLVKLLFK